VRCPQQAALEERDYFPIASEIILGDFYMDDLLTGASSVQKAAKLKQEINYILNEAEFEIFQRASNSVELMPSLKKKHLNRCRWGRYRLTSSIRNGTQT
jgi:hypothetical protein